MKKPYYYEHPEWDSMNTTIRSVTEENGYVLLELEETIFYPGGGGQPADRGSIEGQPVLDVQKSGDRVLHKVEKRPQGDTLNLTLDRSFRDHFAKQHTGQHLISALLLEICGASTLSVHLGEEETTIEVESEYLAESELIKVEERANQEIRKARQIHSFTVKDQEELKTFSTRRGTELSENIRLVEIDGIDRTPCGGVHAGNTSELGLIKYGGAEKIRGHLRLKWKIGAPAYRDYAMRYDQLEKAGKLLCVKPGMMTDRLEQLIQEKEKADKKARSAQEKEAERICFDLCRSVHSFPPLITTELRECSSDLFRSVVKKLTGTEGISFLLCSKNEGRLNWALHLPFHKTFSYSTFHSECLSLIQGKGGGKGPLWQGSGDKADMMNIFISSFRAQWVPD